MAFWNFKKAANKEDLQRLEDNSAHSEVSQYELLKNKFAFAKQGSFCRTVSFEKVDNPEEREFLKAVANDSTGLWTIYKVKEKPNLEPNVINLGEPVQEVLAVEEDKSFFDTIDYLARYETAQPGLMNLQKIGESHEQDLGTFYFRHLAEAEGLVFDTEGLPHPTKNGIIVTNGKFKAGAEIKAMDAFNVSSTKPVANIRSCAVDIDSPVFNMDLGLQWSFYEIHYSDWNNKDERAKSDILRDHLTLLNCANYYAEVYSNQSKSDDYLRDRLKLSFDDYKRIKSAHNRFYSKSLTAMAKFPENFSSFAFYAIMKRAYTISEKCLSSQQNAYHHKVLKSHELYFEMSRLRAFKRLVGDKKLNKLNPEHIRYIRVRERAIDAARALGHDSNSIRALLELSENNEENLSPPKIVLDYLQKLQKPVVKKQASSSPK
jgi:hypothetical protein